MTSIGGSAPSYDGDGNVTNDFLHTYAWNAYGRPTTVDGVTITYDATDRPVEQNRSGSYQEMEYSPTGFLMEIMVGTGSQKSIVPLPGGATAIWTNGDIYYRHPDWLGSSRFTSDTNRSMYSDGAYGPFGDIYAQAGASDESFIGMDQDTSSNLYDFPARELGIQGRWSSPDPLGIGAADPTDPQSWNRYAYVRNSPLSMVDPSGMVPTGGWCDGTSATAEECASEAASCQSATASWDCLVATDVAETACEGWFLETNACNGGGGTWGGEIDISWGGSGGGSATGSVAGVGGSSGSSLPAGASWSETPPLGLSTAGFSWFNIFGPQCAAGPFGNPCINNWHGQLPDNGDQNLFCWAGGDCRFLWWWNSTGEWEGTPPKKPVDPDQARIQSLASQVYWQSTHPFGVCAAKTIIGSEGVVFAAPSKGVDVFWWAIGAEQGAEGLADPNCE